jgi:predicted aspartyl protease
MIEGRVNDESLEPMVEIGLKQGDTLTMIQAVVDTGFSGYLGE